MITFRNIRNAFLAATALILGAGTLTSCDDDNMAAMKLNGEWFGDFGMHVSTRDNYGNTITWDCYDTYMNFNSSVMYSSYGYCKQVDEYPYRTRGKYQDGTLYNAACPWERIYHRVKWSIDNGIITFTYKGESEWNTRVRDYSLSNHYFSGYFSDTGAPFNLESITQGDTWWSVYDVTYDDYYYTRAASDDNAVRADGFTLCKTEEGNTLVDNPADPTIEIVLRDGVDPSSIDLSSMKIGNRHNLSQQK